MRDTYVAQMKGVILGIVPEVQIVDLTHHIPPQDLVAAALTLDAAIDAFPDGTVHVAVVDPGVGSDRAAIAVETDHFVGIGPDNGLFCEVLRRQKILRAVRLTHVAYHRKPVSATFHGRDIFAPVAAHVAAGTSLEELGETVCDLIRLDLPQPETIVGGLRLHVLHIDTFGNLISNLRRDQLDTQIHAVIEVAQKRITGICKTFGDVQPDELVAYFGSSHRLEIAIRNGHAARQLGVQRGDTFDLKFKYVTRQNREEGGTRSEDIGPFHIAAPSQFPTD